MKGLILFADGFEDSEGITTRDALIRAGIEVISASITHTRKVITSHRLVIETDALLSELNLADYAFIILPGGLRGVDNLNKSTIVSDALKFFHDQQKDIFAICAAPTILAKLGYLDGLRFTCYPGCENGINGQYTRENVTISSNHIITAKSMAYSLDFALAIIDKLLGPEVRAKVEKSTKGL